MTDKTIWVWPQGLRSQAEEIRDVAGEIAKDIPTKKSSLSPSKGFITELEASSAVETLRKKWQTYLSGWGRTLDSYADRLDKTADAYEKRDAEAAEELGIELPASEPYRRRPGRSEF